MMRPLRKSVAGSNVTPKPLPVRSCAVRVMRNTTLSTPVTSTPVSLPRSNRETQSNWRNTSTLVHEERKFRGPLKKRPITELTSSATPAKTIVNSKRDVANKSTSKSTPVTQLVAGRARRAIKPNPKYTSEDMVTPRLLKSALSGGKDDDNSTDDFFNDESSADDDDDDDDDVYLDDLIGKAFNDSDKEFTEYNTVSLENTKSNQSNSTANATTTTTATPTTAPRRPRGRPRREPLASPVDSNASLVSDNKKIAAAATTTSTAKNELLTRAMGLRQAQKRVAEKAALETPTTRKRFVFSTDAGNNNSNKLKTMSEYENKATTRSSATTATKPTVTPINKTTSYRLKEILDEALGSDMEEMEEDVAALNTKQRQEEQQENIAVDSGERKKSLTDVKTNSKVVIKKTLPVLRTRMQMDQHGKNNLMKSITETEKTNSDNTTNNNNKNSKNPNEKNMPTFTIVNINDIISKKGDVLISQSSSASTQDAMNNNKITTTTTTTTNGRQDNIPQHRLLKKSPAAASATTTTTTTGSGPTILNHQLANRQLTNKTNLATSKQAPRILNAIVSKKTQPVKPTTQNPDDSAESFTLSLDEDEETDNEVNKTFDSMGTDLSFTEAEELSEDEQRPSMVGRKRSLPLRAEATKRAAASQFLHRNSEADTTDELSSSSRLQTESVEITRQGNKIVKKITCLESWYVITRKNTIIPPAVVRNQFDMPLIELANAATSLELPNDQWSSKVTLFELPAATLAKGNFTTYTGNLSEHNILEEDREKHQPSCVMFRRAALHKEKSRLPYDRAVIFKNKTFYTNIDGKNVRLVSAPNVVDSIEHVEIMLNIMDILSLQSALVETTGSI